MVDRTDIDALLIGALYGELTPADEARLMAHLESHPADRTALDNLTRTRAAVRDSRILAFQVDPPQAISALLLQEASRRAPRARTDRGEALTWFQRFVRSFTAHPAMAAAATLVLVIAAAGTFYLSGTDQFARSEAPSVAAVERAPSSAGTGAAAPSPAARVPEPEAPAAGAAPSGPVGSVAESRDGVAAGSGVEPSRRAQLDDKDAVVAQGQLAEPQPAIASDRAQEQGDPYASAPYEKTRARGKVAVQDAELRKLSAPAKPAPPKADKAQSVRGIELRTRQLQPKDLSDDEKLAGRRESAGEAVRGSRDAAASGGGAPASAPPPPPPPATANAPASRPAGPAAAVHFDESRDPAAAPAQAPAPAANEAKRPAKPSASQLTVSPPGNNAANTASGDAKQTQGDRTLLEWARKQREQVIAYVNANRCRDAASAAVEIYNRAPDYYNANVATDRQIKPCLAYVNAQRDRAERARANKNAADVQAPAQAVPTRK